MAEYDLSKLDPEYEELIYNEGPVYTEEDLRKYYRDRGHDPDNLPVDLETWHEGKVRVYNATDTVKWINIGYAEHYADVLADGTRVMSKSKMSSRVGEIVTWLHKNCKGPFIVHGDGQDDDGNVGFEVMLLAKEDLMRFKLSFTGYI